MNKVTTINLNGNALQLEEGGYDVLRAYLDGAAAKLAGNPDKDEILSDIEQAMAEKFRAVLGAYKNVVTASQVEAVIAEMGPVDAGSDAASAAPGDSSGAASDDARAASGPAPASSGTPGAAKRLYRLHDGAMISGVCNGIAAYFNVDPTIVRLIFIILAVVTAGGAAIAYLAMVFLIPTAKTEAEKSAASGAAFTAQEFIRRAKAGYYEGMKSFPDERARREWQRKFKREMRAWGHSFQWEVQRGAQRWQHNWQRYWTDHPGMEAGWSVALPFLSLCHAAAALACVLAVVSLLTSGTILGVGLPASVPVWLGILLVLFGYGLVTLPLKAARRVFYCSGGCACPGPRVFASVWDSLVWFAFVGVLVWLASRHIPQVNEAIHAIPVVFHAMIDAVRDWWHQR